MSPWAEHLDALERGLHEVDRRLGEGDVEGATALIDELAGPDGRPAEPLPVGAGPAALRVLTRLAIVQEHLAEATDAVQAELDSPPPAPMARRAEPVARFLDQVV